MIQYVTGCTHFGHANIIGYTNRPFASVEEMDEELIRRWNATVRPLDMVYHLGDFAFRDHRTYRERLNGKIVFVRGNHDHDLPFPAQDILTLPGPFRVVLCHYPMESWNGSFRGAPHFHCHTHTHNPVTGRRRRSVTVEAHDYRPVSLERLIKDALNDPAPGQ